MLIISHTSLNTGVIHDLTCCGVIDRRVNAQDNGTGDVGCSNHAA
jgi:hypothetical protein